MNFFESVKYRIGKLGESIVHLTADVIYDRREGFWVSVYAAFLCALSYVFEAVARIRYWLYNKRIMRDAPLGCLVVVVGNLTVGGTGKTPIVEKFARSLSERGRKVAILSRGYKSKSDSAFGKFLRWITHGESPKPRVVSDGKNILLDSEHAGDEPYMLAKNLPGVIVLVDKNRVRAGHYALTEFGVDTLILDDGFQYLPLKGQLQLLLVDKTNPFGNSRLLPRGILREPIAHLKRASYIFLTKSDGGEDPELERLIRTHNPTAEIIECAHKPECLVNFSTGEREELAKLDGAKVACFSAIAVPESFERFLSRGGADIVLKKRFLDHHRFDIHELNAFFWSAQRHGAEFVVVTEKDAVRIDPSYPAALPLYYLRLEIEILKGIDDFESAVEKICFPKRRADEADGGESAEGETADAGEKSGVEKSGGAESGGGKSESGERAGGVSGRETGKS